MTTEGIPKKPLSTSQWKMVVEGAAQYSKFAKYMISESLTGGVKRICEGKK